MTSKIPNNYIINGNIVKLELRRRNKENLWTTIDLEDLNRVTNFPYSWHSYHNIENDEDYAVACLYDKKLRKKYGCYILRLHVFIMEGLAEHGKHVDHINHNTLDNRKENLRIADHDDNNKSRKGSNSNNKLGIRNVFYDKQTKKYIVQLQVDGKNTRLGEYNTLDEAAYYAKIFRDKYYGQFAGVG